MKNAFYFGDNLHVLREYIPDESVDLIYLDPPFNSNATYNLLFRSPDKKRWSDAQIAAFDDTWSWGENAEELYREITMAPGHAAEVLTALKRILGPSNMLAYLTMMTARLIELNRVLARTGSLYLHCDPTASHYLKILLDGICGAENYRTEISWRRQSAHNDGAQGRKQYGNVRDIIFFYSRSSNWTWNPQFTPYDSEYVNSFYRHVEPISGRRYRLGDITAPGGADPKKRNPHYEFLGVTRYWRYSEKRMHELYAEGRIVQTKPGNVPQYKRYLDEMPGVALQNDWDDIRPLQGASREKIGYPTQKPVSLLQRIIEASSNEGDVVLDPFCGCGTTLEAAQSLGRSWIGIDVAIQAMKVVGDRLSNEFPGVQYDVFGFPTSMESALWLAANDPFQFEEWAVLRVGGMHSGKYRSDGGIDGTFYFLTGKDEQKDASRGIISVKGGQNVNPGMVRDLAGTLRREREWNQDPNAIAVFICARKPTKGMLEEARTAGFIETDFGTYPAIQILSVEDIFEGASIRVPFMFDSVSASEAARRKGKAAKYIDPRELARQRQFFFSMSGGAVRKSSAVMPEPIARVG